MAMDEPQRDADGVDDSTHSTHQEREATADAAGATSGGSAEPGLSKDRAARGSSAASLSARTKALSAAAVVVAAALLGGSIWYAVDSFGDSAPASATADRDAAVEAARSVGATMTTVNGGDPEGTLQAWRGAITGKLAEQYAKSEAQLTQRIAQTKGSVSSAVTNAALTELDSGAGTATALVFVDTTFVSATPAPAPSASAAPAPSSATDPSAAPAPSSPADSSAAPAPSTPAEASGTGQKQRLALTLAMVRTADGWKVADLQPNEPTQAGQ